MIWSGNLKTLRITSCLAVGIGVAYLIPNLITQSRPGYWIPYAFLIVGSLIITVLRLLILRSSKQSLVLSMVACYGQILLVFIYSCMLSSQSVNYDLPAVSAIVFISILPLSIDDRPIRMIVFVVLESIAYLLVSHISKSPRAFMFDVEDIAAFSLVGIVLYVLMCTRNVRELYQGVRIEKIQKSVITSLATVVEERDEDTGGHIMRCEDYVERLLKEMREKSHYSNLTNDYCENIVLAAAMHDIGKIKIPVLLKNRGAVQVCVIPLPCGLIELTADSFYREGGKNQKNTGNQLHCQQQLLGRCAFAWQMLRQFFFLSVIILRRFEDNGIFRFRDVLPVFIVGNGAAVFFHKVSPQCKYMH